MQHFIARTSRTSRTSDTHARIARALLGPLASLALMLATLPLMLAALPSCVDAPIGESEPQSRLVASWNPLACGDDPHRVVVELEDDDGVQISRSAPCEIGGLSLDVAHWGVYRGRVYAWLLGPIVRSVAPVHIEIDAPVIQWVVETPR